jgi:hypothetical protein
MDGEGVVGGEGVVNEVVVVWDGDVARLGLLLDAERKLVGCWSNIERVFEELGVT